MNLRILDATKKGLVNMGNKSFAHYYPIKQFCHLDLELEEADDVAFSIIGP